MVRRWIVAEESFVVKYDGEAIRDARIDARDLGMSLVGLADLAKAIQATDPDLRAEDPLSLEITGKGEGSFVVDLILTAAGGAWDYSKAVLSSPNVQAILALEGIFTATQGVLRYLAAHGQRQIEGTRQINADQVEISHYDGPTVVVNGDVSIAVQSSRVRKAAYDAVSPLEREGVDSIEISEDREADPDLTISSEDLPNFEYAAATDERPLDDEYLDDWFDITSPELDGSPRWKFNDEGRKFYADVEDEQFLQAVRAGQLQFKNGDVARVWMRQERTQRASKITTRRYVERVMRVRRPGISGFIYREDGTD